MWLAYENQLTPEAARDDAEKLFYTLSKLLHNAVFYHLIYPSSARYFADREDIEIVERPKEFLQHMLDRLGFHRSNFLELLKVSLTDTYAYIISDHHAYSLSNDSREFLESWSNLVYKLYPALSGVSFTRTGQSTRRVEINIYTDEVLSTAVSPRFATALRMLELRTVVVSSLEPPVVRGPDGEIVEYTPKLPEELSKDTAEHLLDRESLAPSDLAFLAGVSHAYVTKLFRAGKIPARKKGKFILIHAETAVAFVISRPAYPKWVKTLADRAKISPLDI